MYESPDTGERGPLLNRSEQCQLLREATLVSSMSSVLAVVRLTLLTLLKQPAGIAMGYPVFSLASDTVDVMGT